MNTLLLSVAAAQVLHQAERLRQMVLTLLFQDHQLPMIHPYQTHQALLHLYQEQL
jgi:hypothetical protein